MNKKRVVPARKPKKAKKTETSQTQKDDPVDIPMKDILYLYNAGFFHLEFAYILYFNKDNKYRLIVHDLVSNMIVDKWFKTIQGAKIEFVTHLIHNVDFLYFDPAWHPLAAPQKLNWTRNMNYLKMQQINTDSRITWKKNSKGNVTV